MYARILAAAALTAVLSASPLIASGARTGCTEAQISMLADVRGSHGESRPIVSGSLGYYLTDWLQAGARVTYESDKDPSYWGWQAIWGLGGYVQCDWNRWNCSVVPYLKLGYTALSADTRDTVNVVSAAPGLNVFLAETISLSAQVNFDFATEEIYNVKVLRYEDPARLTTGDKNDISCTFGVRFLFF